MMNSWKTLGLATACLGVVSLPGATVDLSKGGTLHPAGKPAQVLKAENGTLSFQWNPAESQFVGIALPTTELPVFTGGEATAMLELPAGSPVTWVGLQVADAKGEVFQFKSLPVNFAAGGTVEVKWNLDPNVQMESWGGDNNKRFDQPGKIVALGLNYSREASSAQGKLLSLTTETRNASAGEPIVWNSAAGVTKYVPTGNGSVPTPIAGSADGAVVQFDPQASKFIEVVLNNQIPVPQFSSLAVTAKFSAPAGCPVRSLGLRLIDAKGEVFQFSHPVDFKTGGDFDVEWQLTPASEGGSWGGNNDKKIDFPAKIQAFGVDYAQTGNSAQFTLKGLTAQISVAGAQAGLKLDVAAGGKKYLPGIQGATDLPYVAVPGDAGKKGIEVSWETARTKYIEVVFNSGLKVPEFTTMTVSARVYAPEGCPVRSLGLRVMDAKGEVFQFSKPVDFKSGGVFDMIWEVPATGTKNSWGANADHQIDMPARVYGFGVDYDQSVTEGKFYFLEINAVISGGAETAAVRPLYRFNGENRFSKLWGTAVVTPGDGALTLTGIQGKTSLQERKDSLFFYHARPVGFTLDADLIEGGLDFSISFRDAANNVLESAPVVLKSGRQRLNIDLKETLAKAQLPLRVERINFGQVGNEPGSVILRGSQLALAQPIIEAVDFDVLTDTTVGVLRKGSENALRFRFSNVSNQPGNFTFDLEFENFDGEKFQESFSAALQPGEVKEFTPSWKPDSFGHWQVTATVREQGSVELSCRKTKSFAYLEPAGPTPDRAPGFLFSICTHTGRWSKADQIREVEAAALCGAKVIRESIEWGGLQPAEGEWNWEPMDFLVNSYGAVGIELQSLLAFTAKWAAPLEKQNSKNWLDWSRCQPDLNAWRNYVRSMAERYRGRIRYWEVWNEPDLAGFNGMSLEEYVELQKAAYEEIQKVAPEAFVMSGGFATMSDHPGRKDKDFHRNYLKLAKGAFEVHAYHEHGSFLQYAQLVDGRFLPMRAETGTEVPWYANETAIASMNGSEKNQAVTLFKKLLFAWARGAIGYTWYDLRNDGWEPANAEHHYGMVTNDFQPKPVYSVFNHLAGLYRSAEFVRQFDLGTNRWAFEFRDGDTILIPAWDESGFAATQSYLVKTDAEKATIVDIMGNERPAALLDGMVILELDRMPATLKLTGAANAEIDGRILTVDAAGVAVPGKSFAIDLKLRNPLSTERKFQLSLKNLPAGLVAKEADRTVAVPANGTAEVRFDVAVSADFRADYGNAGLLRIEYAVDGTEWRGSSLIPLNTAVSVPRGTFDRKPDFELNSQNQVISLTGADPALAHRVWRNAQDLSAKIWLGASDGIFRLRADVTDDVHSQPYNGVSVWQGDNIQFCFQLPGQSGYWEIGLSRLDTGKPEVFVFQTPDGFDAAKVAAGMKLTTERNGNVTRYDVEFSDELVGMTPEILHRGFRFNLLVNDNDGEGRDGWIHIAPGIGANKNPDKFPFLVFE